MDQIEKGLKFLETSEGYGDPTVYAIDKGAGDSEYDVRVRKQVRNKILGATLPVNRKIIEQCFEMQDRKFGSTREEKEAYIAEALWGSDGRNAEVCVLQDGFTPGERSLATQFIAPIQSFALAQSNWGAFAEINQVLPGRLPGYASRSVREVEMHYTGRYGQPPQNMTLGDGNTVTTVNPYYLETDEYVFPNMDDMWPDEVNMKMQEISDMMSYSILRKAEELRKDLLDSGVTATFDSSAYTYKSSELQGFPSGNYIDLSSGHTVGGTTYTATSIDKTMFAIIFNHFQKLGLQVVEIICNPDDLMEFWINAVSVTTSASNAVQNFDPGSMSTIVSTGKLTQLFGNNFQLRTDNTLPAKTLYVRTNRPAFIIWKYVNENRLLVPGTVYMSSEGTMRKIWYKEKEASAQPYPYTPHYAKILLGS